jgi:hypothetical protein
VKPSAAPSRASNLNRVSAAAVAAFATAALAGTWWFDPVPPGLPGLGAVEFPRLICILLLALSAGLALQPAPEAEPAPPLRGGLPIYLACLAFLLVMAVVGLLGATALFLVAAGWLWGERRLPLLVTVSAALTLAIWAIFVKVFGLTLPQGMVFGG